MRYSREKHLKFFAITASIVVILSVLLISMRERSRQDDEGTSEDALVEVPVIIPHFFPDKQCNVKDYVISGYDGQNKTNCINDAISDCAKDGGGKVVIPKGRWLTGPINLKSNINLYLDEDAEIIFSTNFDDYLPPVFSRFEGIELYNYSPLIYAKDCENVAITGKGTLDGQGEAWWSWKREGLQDSGIKKLHEMAKEGLPAEERIFGNTDDALRPSFIQFINCKNILLEDFRIKNGPMWTIHPIYSEEILIKNIAIETAAGPNTDGIVIDSSRNVTVEGCHIDSGDDAIALKSGRDKDGLSVNKPSENIHIKNCAIKEGHSAIAIGSEMSGGVKNVLVEDLKISRVDYGVHIKTVRERGGVVENILVQDLEIEKATSDMIRIDMQYTRTNNVSNENLPIFRNIHFKNISCQKTDLAFFLRGLAEKPIENVYFENVNASSKKDILKENVIGDKFKDIKIRIRK